MGPAHRRRWISDTTSPSRAVSARRAIWIPSTRSGTDFREAPRRPSGSSASPICVPKPKLRNEDRSIPGVRSEARGFEPGEEDWFPRCEPTVTRFRFRNGWESTCHKSVGRADNEHHAVVRAKCSTKVFLSITRQNIRVRGRSCVPPRESRGRRSVTNADSDVLAGGCFLLTKQILHARDKMMFEFVCLFWITGVIDAWL